jgi:hypothetical protein
MSGLIFYPLSDVNITEAAASATWTPTKTPSQRPTPPPGKPSISPTRVPTARPTTQNPQPHLVSLLNPRFPSDLQFLFGQQPHLV